MTVREAIEFGEQELAAVGIESAALDAQLLLGHLLDIPHLELWLRQSDPLSAAQAGKFSQLLERRRRREPLQHITGWTSFLDLTLHVGPDVLIPRPETEILAQKAIEFLKSRTPPVSVLDWGTGSGCLALSIARALPRVKVTALDASPDALRIARANAIAHRLADSIRFVEGQGLEGLGAALGAGVPVSPFDAIVSNPPYIPTTEIGQLQPEVRDHDPRLALDGGPDGLDCFRELARIARPWLKPGGRLLVEFGDGQGPALTRLFAELGWESIGIEKDLSGRERILIVGSPQS